MRTITASDMTSQTVKNKNMSAESFEIQFRCCICLDTYSNPVSIPCGHNFCLDCIEGFWDTKDKSECPLCKERFKKRPELRINRGFADVIEVFKRSQSPAHKQEDYVNVVAPPADEVPCDICHGNNKSTSVKACLVCQASYCELHLTPHLRDPVLHRHRLTDPAIFPDSHLCRKHNKPLTMFCKADQTPVCERCTERGHKHHQVVVIQKACKRIKTDLRTTKINIQQMIQARLTKMGQIKHSVDMSKKIREREIKSGAEVCTMLIAAVQRHQVGLVEQLKERQEEAERKAEKMIDELEKEIHELQAQDSELQHLDLAQNPLHLLQSFPSLSKLPPGREWSEVTVHSDNCMGTVSRAFSKLVDICQGLANKLSAEEADKMDHYAVDVTLDPDTASGWLLLSPDRKKVSVQANKAPITDNPQRFDSCLCILGKQKFATGRCYWVVQVGDKTDWDLGIARESIKRKGAIIVRPDNGYWAICRRKGGSLSACAGPSVTLNLRETPQKVGVFLDYEEGSVSFYDAEANTHIYTYSGITFTEPLYPYFNPCVQENGKNTGPLVICPVEPRVREVRDITTQSEV